MFDFKETRIREGLSLHKAADLAKIDRVTLATIESGGVRPTLRTLKRLSKLYQIPLEEMLETRGTMRGTLRWYRERLGLTYEDVADNLYIDPGAVLKWEYGASRTRLDMREIADLYQVSVQDIQAAFDRAIEERKNKKGENKSD